MGITLFISAFDEDTFKNGWVSYSNQYLDNITNMFSDFSTLSIDAIDGAVGVFVKKDDNHQLARLLEVVSLENTGSRVSIRFKVKAVLETDSGSARRGLRGQLIKAGFAVDGPYLPLCCLVDTENVEEVLSPGVESQLSLMHSHHDWIGIHTTYWPIADLARNHPDVWTDVEALNMIGFACAKLAETSGNLKSMFRDQAEKQDFLIQQSRYRLATEALRKKCIELQPDNAGLWSNLAYFHYQNARELIQPGGRRDGNLREEIDTAVKCLNKALDLDDTRISDFYRRGYLLADMLPKQILFGAGNGALKERSEQSRECTREGIDALESAIKVWEGFAPEDRNRKRYQKDYIKSLYQAGGAYYSLIINDWDDAIFMLELGKLIDDTDKVPINLKDLENANKAWECFYACWYSERSDLSSDIPSEKSTSPSGAVDGVFKLYSLGKVRFARFWILTGGGQKQSLQTDEERDEAERLLVAALNLPWPLENQRQKKDFIAELLARLYISRQQYNEAAQVIQEHTSRNSDAYVALTLADALVLSKQYAKAQQVLDNALSNRGNKALWKTHLNRGCAFLREGLLAQAKQALDAADKEARQQGKQTVDTILIARAFVSYRSGDIKEAVDYLVQALALNPHRVSVQKRLKNWQDKLNRQPE